MYFKNNRYKLILHEGQGDPINIVKKAKELKQNNLKEANLKEAKRQHDDYLKYEQIWVMFDRDSFERVDEALNQARANGFNIAFSNPCFELWLLLHFQSSPGMIHRNKLSLMIKKYLPKYNKHIKFVDFVDNLPHADKLAEQLDIQAEKDDDKYRNPSTTVYLLTRQLSQN